MKIHRKILRTVLAIIFFQAPSLFAQKSTARFLYFRPSAVSSSMGGIGVAYFHDAYSAYFNPAGLAFSPTFTAAGSFDQPLPIFPGEGYSFIGTSGRIGHLIAVGLSTNLYWKGDQALTASNGPAIVRVESPFDWQGKISFAYRVGENTAVGASVSLLESTISDYAPPQEVGKGRSSDFLFDLGFLRTSLLPAATVTTLGPDLSLPFESLIDRRAGTGISFGLSLLNLGAKMKYIAPSQSDPPPSTLLIGATYYPLQTSLVGLIVGLDAEKRLYDGGTLSYLHYGVGLTLLRILSVRAGYFQGTASGENSFFTFGGGMRFKYFSVNFARCVQAILPTWQFDGRFQLEI